MIIKSKNKNYNVIFTNNYIEFINKEANSGGLAIIDKNISILYPEIINKFATNYYILDSNEISKSYNNIENIIQFLVDKGFRKNQSLIAIGGGITQDVCSFISMIIYRGVEWQFFPTNLLSQCDSCIGSKISINLKTYKNLIGGFYPPSNIYIDYNFLSTLNSKDIKSGLGEMLHYCLVSSENDFVLFLKYANSIIQNINNIEYILPRVLEIKKNMVEIDEFDDGPRMIFNYGHTFAHALESALDYKIPHGIAVAYGIDLANLISVNLNYISKAERNRIKNACEIIYDDFKLPKVDINKFHIAIKKDKKNKENLIGLILTKGIGNMFLEYHDFDDFKSIIINFFENKFDNQNI